MSPSNLYEYNINTFIYI